MNLEKHGHRHYTRTNTYKNADMLNVNYIEWERSGMFLFLYTLKPEVPRNLNSATQVFEVLTKFSGLSLSR